MLPQKCGSHFTLTGNEHHILLASRKGNPHTDRLRLPAVAKNGKPDLASALRILAALFAFLKKCRRLRRLRKGTKISFLPVCHSHFLCKTGQHIFKFQLFAEHISFFGIKIPHSGPLKIKGNLCIHIDCGKGFA